MVKALIFRGMDIVGLRTMGGIITFLTLGRAEGGKGLVMEAMGEGMTTLD